MAFLAEQGVAAVTGSDALDTELLRKVHDEAPLRIQVADRMQPFDEGAFFLNTPLRLRTHSGHEFHVHDDVGTVGYFDAQACVRRIDGPHAVGNDIHRAALHRTVEQSVDFLVRIGRTHPVIVGAGVRFVPGTDIGQVFDPGNIGRVGTMQVAIRIVILVQGNEIAAATHLIDQALVFSL